MAAATVDDASNLGFSKAGTSRQADEFLTAGGNGGGGEGRGRAAYLSCSRNALRIHAGIGLPTAGTSCRRLSLHSLTGSTPQSRVSPFSERGARGDNCWSAATSWSLPSETAGTSGGCVAGIVK